MDIKEILGEDLYSQITEKLGDQKIAVVSDGSYLPRQRFNEVNEQNKALKSQVESFESQLASAKKLVSSNEELKNQFAELQNKHKSELESIQNNLVNTQKISHVREGLIKAGIKDQYLDLHLKNVKLDSINITDDGVSGVSNIVNDIKSNYADSFQNQTIKTNTNTNQSQASNSWENVAKKFI